jgi:hypothetical protein
MLILQVLKCGGVNVQILLCQQSVGVEEPYTKPHSAPPLAISPRPRRHITTCSKPVPVCSYEYVDTDEAFSWLYAATE